MVKGLKKQLDVKTAKDEKDSKVATEKLERWMTEPGASQDLVISKVSQRYLP